ncbi:MAG: formate--tetrahydrofolate ligase [Clostridia bacterium]|jgi:formate--tetrahydrofolate ligase|nr:formate--tetrahydrofolate ligase [Clostridia bacterium]
MEDIEIARNTQLEKITKIAEEMNIQEDQLEQYGKYKAKISPEVYKNLKDKKDGKLILVTAINPTPLGEGKTTMAIGLADGLRKTGKNAVLALREPSLGPVFGIKGGATGGGHSQIAPMEDINLHFTGDIHAITSANNLLSAMIDNHIYFGNELGFDRVVWKRCVDLNDRQLRVVNTGLSQEKNIVPRMDGFDISVASEIMAIFCLATDINDLKRRIGNIIVGYTKENKPITAKDLKADGAMTVLLKDAINPNLVQSLEQTPAIVHGGPFANIAHGCNSIIATKLALKLGDYVVTEAGFGADLGAEKFLDIKCRKANLKPDAVVCVATIKALKYHGGMPKEDIKNESIEYLAKGFKNLERHVDNLKNCYSLNVIVAINKYTHDTEAEIKFLQEKLQEKGINLSLVESWEKGGKGAKDLAQKIVDLVQEPSDFKFAYELNETIENKIKAVAQKIYGAEDVEFTEEAKLHIKEIEDLGYSNLPVCIAKTQYSFSDDPKNLECKEPFNIHVQDVVLRAGAEFIVVLTGKIMTMPGLPKIPSAENIDLDENGNIVGIF